MFSILGWKVFYKNFVKFVSSFLVLAAEAQKGSFEADSGYSASYYDV